MEIESPLPIIEILNYGIQLNKKNRQQRKKLIGVLLFQKAATRETKSTLHHFWLQLEVRN